MVEPLACCLRGVERAQVAAGDRVAIVGAGPIGLMLAACVRDAGGRPEIVGGRPERRTLAPLFGAEVGDGEGADVVVEAAGTEDAWQRALELVRPGGTVVYFGGRERGSELRVDTYRLHYEELTLRGAFHHAPRHVRAALAFLASGAYPWERLITHRVGLEGVAGSPRRPAGRLPQGGGRALGSHIEPGVTRRATQPLVERHDDEHRARRARAPTRAEPRRGSAAQTPLRPPPQRTRPLRRARSTRSTPTRAPARPSPAENPSVSARFARRAAASADRTSTYESRDEYTSSRATKASRAAAPFGLADESRREGGGVGVPVQPRESRSRRSNSDAPSLRPAPGLP